MWLWTVFGWLLFASFIAKAKSRSHFSILKFSSVLASYKGCEKNRRKKAITGLCIITWSSITTWKSYLLAQLRLTYLPLSLRTNDRQAPLLRVIPSDKLNQSVLGLGLGYHQTGWSCHLRIPGTLKNTRTFLGSKPQKHFIKEGTSYRQLIFQSLKFHQIRLLLYRQGCHHATRKL